MLPLGHVAVALAASDLIGGDTRVAVLSSQLPDLVDKPMAWIFNTTDSSRYVAHTLLATTACLIAASVAGGRPVARGVLAGYLTHLAADQMVGGKVPLLWPFRRYQLGHKSFRPKPRAILIEIAAGAYIAWRWRMSCA
ncbi:MAG TPA: metal-dependent hydrolase [Dehalococcoidia bacterium]|nr:metal-dependent hydrolase [Dehalococcoidia bacterium]